jgi:hypothetical protein
VIGHRTQLLSHGLPPENTGFDPKDDLRAQKVTAPVLVHVNSQVRGAPEPEPTTLCYYVFVDIYRHVAKLVCHASITVSQSVSQSDTM